MRQATERQAEILRFIADTTKANGYPPTIREIGDAHGISSLRGVTVHLDAMERKRYISRGHKSRQITITEVGQELLGPRTVTVEVRKLREMRARLAHVESILCVLSSDCDERLCELGRAIELIESVRSDLL